MAGRHPLPRGLGEELGLGGLQCIGDGLESPGKFEPTPGPGAYNRDVPFGSDAPAVSILLKHDDPPNLNPSPATYFPKIVGGRNPKFTFGVRTREPTNSRPGPSDYSPPRTPPTAPYSPSYTIAERTGPALFEDIAQYYASIPAANAYHPKLPRGELGVTLKGRNDGPMAPFSAPKATTGVPAPGQYNPQTLHTSPAVSLAPRILEDTLHPPLPSPTAYAPNFNANSTLSSPPRFSLGVRRGTQFGLQSHNEAADVPAPGSYSYDVRVIKKAMPKISLKGKWKVRVEHTPGPGAYGPVPPKWQDELAAIREDRKRRAKAAKERAVATRPAAAHAELDNENVVPQNDDSTDGEGVTQSKEALEPNSSNGADEQTQDIGYRQLQINEIREDTPGPAAYETSVKPCQTGTSPAFSFGGRLEVAGLFPTKSSTPAPNAYDPLNSRAALSNVVSAPQVTLKGRSSPFRVVNSRQLKVADVVAWG
ncbi:hypothetical protein HDU93_002567 [Gonapodya sp. JEL0774]|nr:hypothetical protein HDU93_002567 [Gonapodya sp. JEL0774]